MDQARQGLSVLARRNPSSQVGRIRAVPAWTQRYDPSQVTSADAPSLRHPGRMDCPAPVTMASTWPAQGSGDRATQLRGIDPHGPGCPWTVAGTGLHLRQGSRLGMSRGILGRSKLGNFRERAPTRQAQDLQDDSDNKFDCTRAQASTAASRRKGAPAVRIQVK